MRTHHLFSSLDAAKALCCCMALTAAVACSTTEPASNARVSVSVDNVATLASYPLNGSVTATIPLTIRNTGTTSVWYNSCGNSLERRNNGEWDQVWAQICALSATLQPGGTQGVKIAPGEDFTAEVQVMAWLGEGWTGPLSGDYHLRAGLFTERGQLAAEARTSAQFQFQIQVR